MCSEEGLNKINGFDEIVKISVVIITWNSEKHILRMMESLISDLKDSSLYYEIFIVDNGSKDKTVSIVKENFLEDIVLIQLGKNMGTTFSRNIGLRMCTGEFVVILDSDTLIPKGSLNKLVEAFEDIDSDKIGLIHPKLVYSDGTFQESARKFPTLKSKFFRFFDLENSRKKTESIKGVLEQEVCKVDYAISAAWIVRRDIFDKFGYLDEKIFYAPEDAEFCARIWNNGYEVWYYPKVEIIHDCQRITKRKPFTKMWFSHLKGLFYFWNKFS